MKFLNFIFILFILSFISCKGPETESPKSAQEEIKITQTEETEAEEKSGTFEAEPPTEVNTVPIEVTNNQNDTETDPIIEITEIEKPSEPLKEKKVENTEEEKEEINYLTLVNRGSYFVKKADRSDDHIVVRKDYPDLKFIFNSDIKSKALNGGKLEKNDVTEGSIIYFQDNENPFPLNDDGLVPGFIPVIDRFWGHSLYKIEGISGKTWYIVGPKESLKILVNETPSELDLSTLKKIGSGGEGDIYIYDKENVSYALKVILDEHSKLPKKMVDLEFTGTFPKVFGVGKVKCYKDHNCLSFVMELGIPIKLKKDFSVSKNILEKSLLAMIKTIDIAKELNLYSYLWDVKPNNMIIISDQLKFIDIDGQGFTKGYYEESKKNLFLSFLEIMAQSHLYSGFVELSSSYPSRIALSETDFDLLYPDWRDLPSDGFQFYMIKWAANKLSKELGRPIEISPHISKYNRYDAVFQIGHMQVSWDFLVRSLTFEEKMKILEKSTSYSQIQTHTQRAFYPYMFSEMEESELLNELRTEPFLKDLLKIAKGNIIHKIVRPPKHIIDEGGNIHVDSDYPLFYLYYDELFLHDGNHNLKGKLLTLEEFQDRISNFSNKNLLTAMEKIGEPWLNLTVASILQRELLNVENYDKTVGEIYKFILDSLIQESNTDFYQNLLKLHFNFSLND